MKASVFIKVALIDQMQQIADLGLWYHLATLIAKGVNTLAYVVNYSSNPEYPKIFKVPLLNGGFTYVATGNPEYSSIFNLELFKGKYEHLPPVSDKWGWGSRHGDFRGILLFSEPEDADKNATYNEDGQYQIHLPAFFQDYLEVANRILRVVEMEKLEDFELIYTK